jgi:lipoate---protein ligase
MTELLDLTLPTPAENLACDEVLVNGAEAGGSEILRFWESREYFVVVGYANRVETEVNVTACAARKIPIFRRCSGGGTVLQGPGCLNYTLVLQIAYHSALANISSANKFIMERNREAIESEVRNQNPEARIAVCGHTDLALITDYPNTVSNPAKAGEGGALVTYLKFSGNSQRRHKRALLFHGTFLLNFDLPLVNELLWMPSKQPDYRGNREHGDFLANLNVPAGRLKQALAKIWSASRGACSFSPSEVRKLAVEKYSAREWNFRL